MRARDTLRSRVEGLRRRFGPRRGAEAERGPESLVDGEFISKLNRLSLQIGKDLIAGLMGEHRAARRTSGIEFADHREYTLGDDLRRVDWNAYARLGTLHIRQAQAEHDTVLYMLVDSSPSMEFGTPSKFFMARRLAAALGYIALAHLDRVVLSAPGSDLSIAGAERVVASGAANAITTGNPGAAIQNPKWTGRAEAGLLFRHLQDLRVGRAVDFDDVLGEWSTRRGQGRVAVVISDLLSDGYRSGVRQLVGAGFSVTVLHVLSPDELRPDDEGDLELVDSETGREMELHLGHESLREYHRRLDAWLEDVRNWAASTSVGYLLVESDWDVERVLLQALRSRGMLS